MAPGATLADSVRRASTPRARRDVLRRASAGAASVPALLEEARALRRKDGAESARLARAAVALARRARARTLQAQAERAFGQCCLLLGRPRHALRHLRAALRDADPSAKPLIASEVATALSELGRREEARAAVEEGRRGLVTPALRRFRPFLDVCEANLLQRLDRPAEALALLERARRAVARRKEQGLLATVDVNRANVLTNLHRYEHAEALYRRVTAFHRSKGQEAAALQAEYNRAYLRFLRGRFHDALARLLDLRARFEAAGDARHVALCDLDSAEIHLRLNLPEAAETLARRAADAFDRLGIAQDAARARFFVAAAARGVGAAAEARAALERARAEFARLGCEAWEAVCLHRLAELDREAGDRRGAAARAAEAARRLAALGFAERAGRAECLAAAVETEGGDPAAALARLATLRRRAKALFAPWLLCEAHHRTAEALVAAGRPREALRSALRATRVLERHRVAAPPDEYMAAFLRDKARIPALAVELLLRLGTPRAVERAFEVAEGSKGRALADLLRGRLPPTGRSDTTALRREADDLLREIEGFSGRLPGAEGGLRGVDLPGSGGALEARERRLAASLSRLAVRDPDGALLRTMRAPKSEDVVAALPADTTLVEYFQCESGLFAFVLSREGLRVVRHDLDAAGMASALERMRFHLDRPPERDAAHEGSNGKAAHGGANGVAGANGASAFSESVRRAQTVLADLDRVFVEPVRPLLATKRVVVVPHGELHGVPFPALGREGRTLLDDHEVVVSPSTAVFLHGLSRPREDANGCVLLGVADDAAPLIAEEVRRIERIHPGAQAFLGGAATRAALVRAGGRARWVHVASHAAFRTDDPMRSGLLLSDGWLTTQEAYDLRLAADVVVLSGCATGRSGVTEGDDLLGLVRGFLHAGARNLVTSLWPVADAPTVSFMERLHEALAAGTSPAAALRAATLSVRRDFPHPYHWAAFVLTGTGGTLSGSPS